jgi:hypothetical protein
LTAGKFQGRVQATFVGGERVSKLARLDVRQILGPQRLAVSAPCPRFIPPDRLALGYLLGIHPFGLFFTWVSGAGDVRKIGSGNIGATNVLRTGKKWAAARRSLCDGAKGAAAVLCGAISCPARKVFAGWARCWAISFPVWLRFKGGKGVATFLGICFALYWPVGPAGRRDLAGRGLDLAHLVPVGLDRHCAVISLLPAFPSRELCGAGAAAFRAHHVHASRQYPPAVARTGTAHRCQE